MKPIGPIIKRYIEEKSLSKREVADKLGITYNYLSTIFHKDTLDASLLERLCIAIGLSPMSFFEVGEDGKYVTYSDIQARTQIGSAAVNINHNSNMTNQLLNEKDKLIEEKNRLIEEKERTIQILMAASNLRPGAESGHMGVKN